MLIVGLLAAIMVAGSGLSTAYLLTKDKIPTEVLDVLTTEDKPEPEEPDLSPTPAAVPPPPPQPNEGGDDGAGDQEDDEEDEDTADDSSTDDTTQDPQDASSTDSSDSSDSQDSQEEMSEEDLNELIKKLFKRISENHGSWSSKATVGGTYEMYSSIIDLQSALERYQQSKAKGTGSDPSST